MIFKKKKIQQKKLQKYVIKVKKIHKSRKKMILKV